jgi:predicted DNA-binding transcriptional regulator YafY
MNPFEKIFNYQIISRLTEAGSIAITAHERIWLKTMLAHPAAEQAFTADTLRKLHMLLQDEQTLSISDVLQEKARSVEKQVYHPLLRQLRRAIMHKHALNLTFRSKHGGMHSSQKGFPFKLEYSMVKREWYLLWQHMGRRSLMLTKLQHILAIEQAPIHPELAERIADSIRDSLESRKERTDIELLPAYNPELSRVLYAFSCFEKNVSYNAETDTYRITLVYSGDEREFVLSKIRFLGQRVRIADSDKLRERMLETARKALARYGELQ